MTGTWYNADGLKVRYPEFYKEDGSKNRANLVNSYGREREIVIDFDLELLGANGVSFTTDRDNDGTVDGFNEGDVTIPAGAIVTSAEIFVDEAAAGGTSVALGGFEADGSAIDADGLVTAANGATANLTLGGRVAGSGADINTNISTTLDAHLALTVVGTFTAGKGRVVVKYVTA